MAICRIIWSSARVYRVGVGFGLVRSELLLADGTCIVLLFEAMPGLCCFLHVTKSAVQTTTHAPLRSAICGSHMTAINIYIDENTVALMHVHGAEWGQPDVSEKGVSPVS